jgi:hypothetical protein
MNSSLPILSGFGISRNEGTSKQDFELPQITIHLYYSLQILLKQSR